MRCDYATEELVFRAVLVDGVDSTRLEIEGTVRMDTTSTGRSGIFVEKGAGKHGLSHWVRLTIATVNGIENAADKVRGYLSATKYPS